MRVLVQNARAASKKNGKYQGVRVYTVKHSETDMKSLRSSELRRAMRLILPLLAVVPMGTVQATVLPPGTSGLPDLFAPPAGSILLASTGVVHWTNSVGTMSGTFTSEVFRDP